MPSSDLDGQIVITISLETDEHGRNWSFGLEGTGSQDVMFLPELPMIVSRAIEEVKRLMTERNESADVH